MKSNKPVGCWVVAVASVGIVIFMVAGIIYGLVRLTEGSGSRAKETHEKAEQGPMVITADESGDLPRGERPHISIREYLGFTHDRTLTTLAREEFEELADGALIDWTMKLADVNETGGQLQAGMYCDYLLEPKGLENGAGRERMTLAARVLLSPEDRDVMLKTSRGDAVRFQGTLRLGQEEGVLVEDARLVVE
ncbi:hypothetical protein [Haloferula sargassicola]|uniref:LPS export ABC transporter periplasmic protein LptC n=1 Tax=Haloferula sargassicola TaxID=490096 RepID=A0ABP9UP15_9BACT